MKKEKIKSILILSIVSILLIMLTGCGTTKEKNEEECPIPLHYIHKIFIF